MYSTQQHPQMPPPQSRTVAPETFLLDQDAQNALPPESIVALQQVDNLKYFLLSAPVDWSPDQYIRRFLLPTGEYVSCVLWNNLFHISGTDIVRCLSFRFQAFGRPVKNSKKFEEGIFSDLRNLKSGTDASLEEPKSKFLDFLYKNNCIRTQKKQKVFYWYSVPHDRLFLDALERDLKREKMGQEATTVAVAEPALSFEFDSSQSLFEQLTKAQQTNSSSFNNNNTASSVQSFSQSPAMRPVDAMPPPMSMPMQAPMSVPPPMLPEEPLMNNFGMNMAGPVHPMIAKSREQDYMARPMHQFTRDGVPLNQVQHRHSSMPVFMEYSPAPSLAMSHYEDYSNRAMSFEPMTPPQANLGMGPEPAYIANEETGLYSAIPDLGGSFNPLMQMPTSTMVGPQFGATSRPSFAPPNVYSVLEGSPTYKQRRRRSSISQGMAAAATNGVSVSTVHRPSDLRRSVSASVAPVAEVDEAPYTSPTQTVISHPYTNEQHISRHTTPCQTVETSPIQQQPVMAPHAHHQDELVSPDALYADSKDFEGMPLQHNALARTAGVFRRARSATMMELGPYPQKSHSCPIPTCGRLFKRLEHLKRHVRTHTQERPYVCNLCSKAFSRSDNLAQHRRTHEQQQNEDGTINEEPLEGEFSEEDFVNLGSDPATDLVSLVDDDNISPTSASDDHHSLPSAVSQTHSHWDSFAATTPLQTPMGMSTGGNVHGPSMNGTTMAPPQMVAAHNY